MRKYFKLNIIELFLVIGFLISAFSFSIIISSTYRYYKAVVEENKFNKDYNLVTLQPKDNEVSLLQATNILEKAEVNNMSTFKLSSIIEVGDKLIHNNVMGVLGGFDVEKYSSIEGRNFTEDELSGNKKVALIGSGLKKYSIEKDNARYIKIFNDYYEVIGVINNSSFFQFVSVVPLKSFYFIENKYDSFNQLVSVNQLDKLKNIRENNDMQVIIREIPKKSVIKYLMENVRTLKESFYGLALGVINLILFSFFFSYGIKRKIAIMKVLGANNVDILKEILNKMLVISTLGIVTGLLLSKLTIAIMNKGFPSSYGMLDGHNILITCLLVYIISIISSFIILLKVINFKVLKELK